MSDPAFTAPRPDLVLPNELLHKVILWVLCDGVHSICTSTEDTAWEQNMMTTLHQVSPAFKAISSELAAKAFDISRDVRSNDDALLCTFRRIFTYLSLLGARFRHPSEWDGVSFNRTIDCSASPFVFAYALYLSCTSLRRNASRSPPDVFESTHTVILSGLDQSEDLCKRVRPDEITWLLRKSMHREHKIAILGLHMVQGFRDLQIYGNALDLFQRTAQRDGAGPVTGARHMVHISLSKVEGAYEAYEGILSSNPFQSEFRAFELPGVLDGLRCLSTLTVDEDQYDLRKRIKKVLEIWYGTCQ